MKTVSTIKDLRLVLGEARSHGKTIGFVPTMGFLHEGHLSLVDLVRKEGADFVVVSIFVNPAQFGPGEDLDTYPRDEERDRSLLEEKDVDLLFLPTLQVIYPDGHSTSVTVSGVAEPLEGERRPGHFAGVATVVTKLFLAVHPDIAAFGQKDAQQCAVIQRLVRDLEMPVKLVFGEIVRESDGLAMSSRNAYLTAEQRALATTMVRALQAGRNEISSGVRSTETVEKSMADLVGEESAISIDYLRLVDPETFRAPKDFDRDVLLVGAIRIGTTRLIDNVLLKRGASP